MKEFKVNEYITLKLEGDITVIYVGGEFFDTCYKRLLINIPEINFEKYGEINSIDKIIDILRWDDTHRRQKGVEYRIDPDTEFWGYCSNLQVWYEHNYDTRLLHSRISFPLLRELIKVGDPLAKKMFKKEIINMFSSGYSPSVDYLKYEGYLDILDDKDKKLLNKEIIKYFQSEDIISILNLANEGFLDYLDEDEVSQVFLDKNPKLKKRFEFCGKNLGKTRGGSQNSITFNRVWGS